MTFETEIAAIATDLVDEIKTVLPDVQEDLSPILGSNYGHAYDPDVSYVRISIPFVREVRESGGCNFWSNHIGNIVVEVFASTVSGAGFILAGKIRNIVRNSTILSNGPEGYSSDWNFSGPSLTNLGMEESHRKTNIEIPFRRGFNTKASEL